VPDRCGGGGSGLEATESLIDVAAAAASLAARRSCGSRVDSAAASLASQSGLSGGGPPQRRRSRLDGWTSRPCANIRSTSGLGRWAEYYIFSFFPLSTSSRALGPNLTCLILTVAANHTSSFA
jgi:hypothetical protein